MNDVTLNDTVETEQQGLSKRFILTGVIATILIVSGMTVGAYSVLRSTGIKNEALRVAARVSQLVASVKGDEDALERRHVVEIGTSLTELGVYDPVIIYAADLAPIWPNPSAAKLNNEEIQFARILLLDQQAREGVVGLDSNLSDVLSLDSWSIDSWVGEVLGKTKSYTVMIKLRQPSGNVFSLLRLEYGFERALNRARYFGVRVFILSFLCSLVLFLVLYFTFRRGIKTIKKQELKLNQQISRLSTLLSQNKDMQKSMKTASARAVELNEQFLRRVGADLHDGPAQMIGFAILRLNQVSKQEAAKLFGHEFHAVREALDESLEEIRGISSGLVLPELEAMSLEQCMRKVVTLHGAKSKAEVAQFYQDLPDNIPLPIKICAYRFIQEGLNNAHRHGDAEKCRLSAYVKDDELVISLKDNGIGFRKSKLTQGGVHLGLVGLKDRVESLGGKFSINSELGIGTALKVVINLAEDE